jgi:hypothetical protein
MVFSELLPANDRAQPRRAPSAARERQRERSERAARRQKRMIGPLVWTEAEMA